MTILLNYTFILKLHTCNQIFSSVESKWSRFWVKYDSVTYMLLFRGPFGGGGLCFNIPKERMPQSALLKNRRKHSNKIVFIFLLLISYNDDGATCNVSNSVGTDKLLILIFILSLSVKIRNHSKNKKILVTVSHLIFYKCSPNLF